MVVIPGRIVRSRKKQKESQLLPEPKLVYPKVYSPRIEFRRDKRSSVETKVIFRLKKKGRQSYEPVDSENISINELNWTRYRGRIISTYHRRENGTYTCSHIIVYNELNQKLESLFLEAMEKRFK